MDRCHFPGDPRFGTTLYPSRDDVKALANRDFLSTRLLDLLIQRAAPPPEPRPPLPLSHGELTRLNAKCCSSQHRR